MLLKMLKKDVAKNKIITVVLCLFIALSAMLVSGAFRLLADTKSAMDEFFEKAKPIDYVQMVTQMPDEKQLKDFVQKQEGVVDQQTQPLIGIDNSNIFYKEEKTSTPDSVMEYSFVTQNTKFDFLLDGHNQPVQVKQGEVGIPVYVMETVGLEIGDSIRVEKGGFSTQFTVASFVRDSQMNPSLVSSKRFVVSEEDYGLLKNAMGETEYLVEFLLKDAAQIPKLESDYLAAGFPRGIGYDISVIRLMNALTSGISLIILLLIGFILILISVVCLRFTIMAALEEEVREIGVMKAIGIAPKGIQKLYRVKYFAMALVSCGVGFLLSFVFSGMFTQTVQLYMGQAKPSFWQWILPVLGAVVVFCIIGISCNLVLRKTRKITPVQAIRGEGTVDKNSTGARWKVYKSRFPNIAVLLGIRDVFCRFRLYAVPLFVLVLASFLMIVPANLYSTITSPSFVRYTGAGYNDIRVDLRPGGLMGARYEEMLAALAQDTDVEKYAGSVIANYSVKTPEGTFENIQIDNGDFSVFPMEYLEGGVPVTEQEIALSYLNGKNLEKSTGDFVEVLVGGEVRQLKVTGIYQDLTFGGRTAKANLPWSEEIALWYKVHIDIIPGVSVADKSAEYTQLFYPAKVTGVEEYISQTFASTIGQVRTIALVCVGIAAVVCLLILTLFYKMLLAKDRRQIITQKGLGFTTALLRLQYGSSSLFVLLLGIVIGSAASVLLGQVLVGAMLSGMGAAKIQFTINVWVSMVVCPFILVVVAAVSTGLSTRAIHKMENYLV